MDPAEPKIALRFYVMLPALEGEHIYGCGETYVNSFSQNDIKAYRIPADMLPLSRTLKNETYLGVLLCPGKVR